MKVNRAILPAVLWTLFIASSCLLPASAFKKFTFDSLSQLDKLIHLILYVVFVMLWALSLKRVLTIKEKLVLLLVSVAYGVLIEVLQSAMALGRAYDIDDIIERVNKRIKYVEVEDEIVIPAGVVSLNAVTEFAGRLPSAPDE